VASTITDDPVTFTSVLEARRETVDFLARLLHLRRCSIGTRSGTRAAGPFKHSVLAMRRFLDNTRIRQSAPDNAISTSTAYDHLHAAIDVLAECAPRVHDTLPAAKAAGATHLNLDGTLILYYAKTHASPVTCGFVVYARPRHDLGPCSRACSTSRWSGSSAPSRCSHAAMVPRLRKYSCCATRSRCRVRPGRTGQCLRR
jgi:hypothetical protein